MLKRSRGVLAAAARRIRDANDWRAEYKYWAKREAPFKLKDDLLGWTRAFFPATLSLYDTDAHSVADYLSDRDRYLGSRRINGEYGVLIADKQIYHRVLSRWRQNLPVFHGTYSRGRFIPEQQNEPSSLSGFVGALLRKPDFAGLVFKPIHGSRGIGIHFLNVKAKDAEGDLYYNGRRVDLSDLDPFLSHKLRGSYIVEEFINQADYAQQIFPGSVNTIRILVMRDPTDSSIFVARVVHRFGSTSSAPIDSFSKGGVCCCVALDSGLLGRAARAEDGGVSWHDFHPDTGRPLTDVQVPRWGQICETVIRISENLPFLNYIGWDVVLTSEGEVCLVEANGYSGLRFLQVHGPLLSDGRVRRFYEHYGVLS